MAASRARLEGPEPLGRVRCGNGDTRHVRGSSTLLLHRMKEIPAQTLLSALPMFKELDTETLARLAATTVRRPLQRGQTLFRMGDPAAGMYVVVYGEIKLRSRSPQGTARLSGMVGPGQSFGEPVMFLERPALVDAEAATDALLLYLPKESVFAEIERNPEFARRVIAGLSKRIEGLVREQDRQARSSGRARFVSYLLRRVGARPGPVTVTLPVAKAEVASQLNLTAEHFSRILHELARQGLLRVDGRSLTVPDPQRLARLAARD